LREILGLVGQMSHFSNLSVVGPIDSVVRAD